MSTTFYPIAREILHLKMTRCIAAHQDDLKAVDQLSFLEQLNVQCDFRAKELILSTAEETVIPFPLTLSSPYISTSTNQLILNYPRDIRKQAHLMQCESQLAKSL